MIYVSIDDFYEKASLRRHLTREEEIECAKEMQKGNMDARDRLIQSYIPTVAGYMKHTKADMQNLGLVLYCIHALEKAVDSFDFLQESESFSHKLSWYLRQAVTKYIVR